MFNFSNYMQELPLLLMRIPVVLLALTVHETAHGWVAYKLGDPTARSFGRLTLNPLKHLDPIGTLCLILFGFGWAKPVPVNSRHFKKPRRDMALTAVAGPVSNLLLAFVGVLLYSVASALLVHFKASGMFAYVVILFLYVFYYLNLCFAVFNLIPIPPLDGSRLLFIFLPDKYYFGLMKYERYIALVMLLLLWTGALSVPIGGLVGLIEKGMFWVVGLLPFLG